MNKVKSFIAEFIGTGCLVFFGCGTAVVVGTSCSQGCGYILTALAFGLVLVAMAYSIGNVSGCHINPAVSLGLLVAGKMKFVDFIYYVIAQCAGAIAASALLKFLLGHCHLPTDTLGANGLAGVGGSRLVGSAVEVILTFVFVLLILFVTSKTENSSIAGLIIGLTLTLVHILGIGLTGTSVNPARSLGPAIFVGGDALSSLWIFICAPLVGAIFAGLIFRFLNTEKDK